MIICHVRPHYIKENLLTNEGPGPGCSLKSYYWLNICGAAPGSMEGSRIFNSACAINSTTSGGSRQFHHSSPSLAPPPALSCGINPKPKSPSLKWVLNQSKLEVNQLRVDWMEMNGHAKCDLNHFECGLRAQKISLFLKSLMPLLSLLSLFLFPQESYLFCWSDMFNVARRTAW